MAIIKQFDKRSGITYVYESKSYYDKEKSARALSVHSSESLILTLVNSFPQMAEIKGPGRPPMQFPQTQMLRRGFRSLKMRTDSLSFRYLL